MIVDTSSACVTLQPGGMARLHLRAGTRLRGVRGTAWITADNDRRDIVLDPQDEWVLDRDNRVLACALRLDADVVLQIDERQAA